MAETMTVDDQTIIVDDVKTAIKGLSASQDSLAKVLYDTRASLEKITHMLTEQLEQGDYYETLQLSANLEWTLDKHGRRYALVFTPTALSTIAARILGVTGTVTIPAGWSCLNDPNGTVFIPPSGMSQLIVLKYTNFFSGSAA